MHDLANEKNSCTIHTIEWAKNVVTFVTKEEALDAGYHPCVFCMPYEPGAD
jgi:methylphosphotriester-DNA--protein-cysteine methyltransferase